MASSRRSFVIVYVLLVFVPVGILFVILKNGRQLRAPFSIDGAWSMQAVGTTPGSTCNGFFSSTANSPLSISQSGTTLVVAINGGAKTTIGTLDGTSLRAQFTGSDDAANCADRNLTLTATLDPQADPRTLQGTLAVDRCAACSLDFRASRQSHAVPGAKH